MLSGGDKDWGRFPPYRELGYAAAAAAGADFALGSVGAGTGATTVNCKGGIGSASARDSGGARDRRARRRQRGRQRHWSIAAPGSGRRRSSKTASSADAAGPRPFPQAQTTPSQRESQPENTTLAVVATDAILTKAEAKRLAVMAQTGFSRSIYPVHTPLDGDIVFAASTGRKPLDEAHYSLTTLGTIAANVVARAIARGVFAATALPFPDALPSWKDQFGR